MATMSRTETGGSFQRTSPKGPVLKMNELVNVVNNRYKRSMLRRKTLPQGFCYVCSRVDPAGIFKNPNSHLFKKGFFHKGSCEHFPRAPYSTFIADDNSECIPEENAQELDAVSEPESPSITVTIKRTSVTENYGKQYYDVGEMQASMDGSPRDKEQKKVFRLPPVFGANSGSNTTTSNSGRLVPITSEQSFINAKYTREPETEEELIARLNRNSALSEQPTKFRHAISAHSENIGGKQSSDSLKFPALSHSERVRSSPAPGGASDRIYIPSVTESAELRDLESMSSKSQKETPSRGSQSKLQDVKLRPTSDDVVPRIINASDGLDDSAIARPIINDLTALETPGPNRSRPKAGRFRERMSHDHMSSTTENSRPGSGHLRYHHRSSEDDVPSQGFIIPKTPTDSEKSEIKTRTPETLEKELADIGDVSDSKTARSSKMFAEDDESIIFSESASLALRGVSSRGSFCRCASRDRIVQKGSKNVETCKACGKNIVRNRDGVAREGSLSRSASQSSRDNMLYGQHKQRISKTATDEDYMDIESIIYEDDGKYWTSEDGFLSPSHATSTSSKRRYRNAQPYPLVDPNMHREVYLRALNHVQMKNFGKYDVEGFDEHARLSRPHVFSYFQLWPLAGKCHACGNDIGIRPDDRPVPKATKKSPLMKHIFGDVKVEDFYPGGKSSFEKKITPKTIVHEQPRQKSKAREAVSLKYKGQKKQGVDF